MVHGTWAANAQWTRRGSFLSTTLADQLPGEVLLVRFGWSGSNSYAARRDAGVRLAAKLEEIVGTHSAARIFLVAHSHGGNVARYALDQMSPEPQIRGLITLATPFLDARPRVYHPLIWIAIHGSLFPVAWYVLIEHVLPLVFRGFDFSHSIGGWVGNALWLGVGLGGFVIGSWVAALYRGTTAFLSEEATEALASVQDEVLSSAAGGDAVQTPILVMAFRGDEAGLWLRILHHITAPFGLILKAVGVGVVLFMFLVNATVFLDLVLEFAAVIGWSDGGLGVGGPAAAETIWNRVWTTYLTTIAIYLVAFAGIFQVPKLIRGHRLGFGREGFATAFLVKIRARPVPTHGGTVKVARYGLLSAVREALRDGASPLAVVRPGWIHSLLYSSPTALNTMIGWIRDDLEGTLGTEMAADARP